MKKLIARFFLWISGWKIDRSYFEEVPRSVMLAAPHTSNWDFVFALAAFWHLEIDAKYLIKDSYTRGIWGYFFRWTGAIGVNRRRKKNKLVEYGIELFQQREKLHLLIPAEGTRQRVEKWRTGFYHIAREAGVPVTLGYLDYSRKVGGILGMIHLSGNFEADMHFIQEKYRQVKGKYPENYNPEIY